MTGPASSPATLKPKIGLTAEQVIDFAINGLRQARPEPVLALLEEWVQAVKDARIEKSENPLAPAPNIE